MARIPIQIGARLFDSKSGAKDFSRDIIRRYAEGETIVGEDDLFLRDLVAIHPEAAQKIGCGISHFTTQLDPEWRKHQAPALRHRAERDANRRQLPYLYRR